MWKSKTPGIPDEEFERTESVLKKRFVLYKLVKGDSL